VICHVIGPCLVAVLETSLDESLCYSPIGGPTFVDEVLNSTAISEETNLSTEDNDKNQEDELCVQEEVIVQKVRRILESDHTLFRSVITNPFHTLHLLLPTLTKHFHSLRPRPHTFTIQLRDIFTALNFIWRMLFH